MEIVRIKAGSFGQLVHRVPALALLCIYILIQFSSSVWHSHDHDHAHHQPDTACAADPCHMSVYHYGHTGSCNHKAHLTNAVADCNDDHHVALRHIAPTLPHLVEILPASTSTDFVFEFSLSFTSFPSPQSRGPPSLI